MIGRSKLVDSLVARGIDLADPTSGDDKLEDLGILIGVDYFFKLIGASQIEKDVYGIQSRVGTIIGGTLENSSNISCNQVTVLKLDTNNVDSLDDKLQKFWEMDSINLTSSDSKILSNFEESISFELITR